MRNFEHVVLLCKQIYDDSLTIPFGPDLDLLSSGVAVPSYPAIQGRRNTWHCIACINFKLTALGESLGNTRIMKDMAKELGEEGWPIFNLLHSCALWTELAFCRAVGGGV